MKELIEKQIEQAAKALEYADYQIGKMQERERSTPEEKALGYLSAYCERLLQIIQNQQSQIEKLKEEQKGTDEVVKGLVANPDAVRELFEEVCKRGARRDMSMCECGHSIDDHGLPRGCTFCKCASFRGRSVR